MYYHPAGVRKELTLMKFTFAEKRMNSSEDLRAYATKKINKLDRLFRSEGEAFVTFSVERGRFLAEITIKNNGMFYRASELTNDMYASVDSGVAAIERQIRKNKTRLSKKLREDALEREAVPDYMSGEDDDEEDEFKIVRSKRFPIKPMSPQEAILQMNLLGHEFFVYRDDEADDAISVVYRRKDGGYGLIVDDSAK
jgi:putative sigma-54 modulation protein